MPHQKDPHQIRVFPHHSVSMRCTGCISACENVKDARAQLEKAGIGAIRGTCSYSVSFVALLFLFLERHLSSVNLFLCPLIDLNGHIYLS